MSLGGLYLVADRAASAERSIIDVVRAAIRGGLRMLQYRDKSASRREAFAVASQLREIARPARVIFLINDDVDLALAVESDGVHLGQEDLPLPEARKILGPTRLIGVSAREIPAIRQAAEQGADYIAIGPIFRSRVKQAVPPLGCRMIREARQLTDRPLFGIGGIDSSNACEVIRAGADGVAVISALHDQDDIEAATRKFLKVLSECKKDAH